MMQLGEAGEARVRGYLFVLGRALRSFLPEAVAKDALQEIEGHIRERAGEADPEPDERAALERVLAELGPPLRVAQAYSGEMTIEEAVATGRIAPTARALWHVATTTVGGFFSALGLFSGYLVGIAFVGIAVLKPIFPNNVGLLIKNGIPRGFGVYDALPAGAEVIGGYWIIPLCLAIGLCILVGTQRGTMRFLQWFRRRRSALRGIVEA